MSGRPYTYSRGMAIAQLMQDMRRPVLKEIVAREKERYDNLVKYHEAHKEWGIKPLGPHGPRTVYLYGEDLFVSYSDTIDWVPKLEKLTKYGRPENQLTEAQIATETDNRKQFPTYWSDILKKQLYIEPIEGWPTEEEIAAEIAASAEREKRWKGSLSSNDFLAALRLLSG
jgi:hypothetical protein